MPLDNKPFKYLIVYPFNVLSICKISLIILFILSLYGWEAEQRNSSANFLLALFDLLSIAVAAISLWFVVQKFFWRKIEFGFNCIGIFLSFASIFTNFAINFDILNVQTLSHVLTLTFWCFAALWTWRETFDNVSNLFIFEWGQQTDENEIEYLEQHF